MCWGGEQEDGGGRIGQREDLDSDDAQRPQPVTDGDLELEQPFAGVPQWGFCTLPSLPGCSLVQGRGMTWGNSR